MKLTPDTLSILKNFSGINQSILFTPGSVLETISTQKNTLAKAVVAEEFTKEFAIYDLNEFLSVMSLFSDPDLDIQDSFVKITEEGNTKKSVRYFFAEPSMIVTPPADKSRMENAIIQAEVRFVFNESDFTELLKAASVLGSPEIVVKSNGHNIELVATNSKNATTNDYSISLGEGNGTSFDLYFKVENLKVMKGSYEVSISSQLLSHFKNTEIDLEYYVSLEQNSTYGSMRATSGR